MSDDYERTLRSSTGECQCPSLQTFFELDTHIRAVRRRFNHLAWKLRLGKDVIADYWGVFWKHKARERELALLLEVYRNMTVHLLDAGVLHFRAHSWDPKCEEWHSQREGWEISSNLLDSGEGLITINCGQCGRVIAVSSQEESCFQKWTSN